MNIRLKRAYDPPARSDGFRVLVDRVWPRGVRKEDANLDEWLRNVAPSSELRKWFGHDPDRWELFVERYRKELDGHGDLIGRLAEWARKGQLTLVYGARDKERNNAVALKKYLQDFDGG